MYGRTLLLIMVVAALGYGALVFLQWKMGLGEFAKGPEQLTLLRTDRKMVAGGRAGVEYFGREGSKLLFRLHCREKREIINRAVRLTQDERSDEICGVYLRVLETQGSDAFTVRIEVSWDPK